MEYNIPSLSRIPLNHSVSKDWPGLSAQTIVETKNQPHPVNSEPGFAFYQKVNYEILSPEIIRTYQLSTSLLSRSQISELNRMKIRLWIADNCSLRRLTSRTASLACYIMDLYFQKGNTVSLEDFHEFGICCLKIANKLEDNIYIPVSFDVFNRDKLNEMQSSICMKLNFDINPLTFTEIAHCLHYIWSDFSSEIKGEGLSFKSNQSGLQALALDQRTQIVGLNFSYVLLHELLEFTYLILESLKYRQDSMVVNAFYLVFCLQIENYQKTLTSAKTLKFSKRSEKTYLVFDAFCKYCKICNYQLDLKVNSSLLMFLYPVYNALTSHGQQNKQNLANLCEFDPNDSGLQVGSDNVNYQTLHFKNKKQCFKRYMKRQAKKTARKLSEISTQ